jgi:hypothetical protein
MSDESTLYIKEWSLSSRPKKGSLTRDSNADARQSAVLCASAEGTEMLLCMLLSARMFGIVEVIGDAKLRAVGTSAEGTVRVFHIILCSF